MRDFVSIFVYAVLFAVVVVMAAWFIELLDKPPDVMADNFELTRLCVPDGYELISSYSSQYQNPTLILERDGKYFKMTIQYAENGEC